MCGEASGRAAQLCGECLIHAGVEPGAVHQVLLGEELTGGVDPGDEVAQIAFNLGSAIGAFCGGMMIAQGFGWNSVALPAAALSFLAMSALLIYGCHQRRQAY